MDNRLIVFLPLYDLPDEVIFSHCEEPKLLGDVAIQRKRHYFFKLKQLDHFVIFIKITRDDAIT